MQNMQNMNNMQHPSYPQHPTMEGPGSPLNPAKARLTDAEKKKNHIDSEKKRREAIRKGFDKLTEIVPNMEGQARSEAIVLQATVEFMKQRVAEKDAVTKLAIEQGWTKDQVMSVYQKAERDFKRKEAEQEAAVNAAAAAGLPPPPSAYSNSQAAQSQPAPQRHTSTPRRKSASRSRSRSPKRG